MPRSDILVRQVLAGRAESQNTHFSVRKISGAGRGSRVPL